MSANGGHLWIRRLKPDLAMADLSDWNSSAYIFGGGGRVLILRWPSSWSFDPLGNGSRWWCQLGMASNATTGIFTDATYSGT
jgi:hypothetical protein